MRWKPFVLASASQFRPGPPPAPGSPERAAEIAEVKNFKRTPVTNAKALYWQFGQYGGPGLLYRLSEEIGRELAEAGLDGMRRGRRAPMRWCTSPTTRPTSHRKTRSSTTGRRAPTSSIRASPRWCRTRPTRPTPRTRPHSAWPPPSCSAICARARPPLPGLGEGVRGVADLGGDPLPERHRGRRGDRPPRWRGFHRACETRRCRMTVWAGKVAMMTGEIAVCVGDAS